MRTLCAVFAHPDDESFSAGGTLARYADQGIELTLVTATRGEVGAVGRAPVAPQGLAAWREGGTARRGVRPRHPARAPARAPRWRLAVAQRMPTTLRLTGASGAHRMAHRMAHRIRRTPTTQLKGNTAASRTSGTRVAVSRAGS
jgi:hypothetical protein